MQQPINNGATEIALNAKEHSPTHIQHKNSTFIYSIEDITETFLYNYNQI